MQDQIIQRKNADIDRGVLSLLSKGPCTAAKIQSCLSIYSKGQINNCLYERLAPSNRVFIIGNDDNMHPIWGFQPKITEVPEQTVAVRDPSCAVVAKRNEMVVNNVGMNRKSNEKTVVAVDLGNVHDCLPHCESFIDQKYVDYVMAFADYQFAGFGVKPMLNKPKIRVVQSEDQHKNSADLMLVWDCQKMIYEYGREHTIRFVIATRDEGFRSLKTLVEKGKKHSVVFVKDLEQLCKEIGAAVPVKKRNVIKFGSSNDISPPW